VTASRSVAAPPPRPLTAAGANGDPNAGDSYIRRAGRSLIYSYHAALRAIKLYPVENAAVQRALDEVLQPGPVRTTGPFSVTAIVCSK